MKKTLSRINWKLAGRKLDGMPPGDIVGRLDEDWRAYLKWRGRRARMSSLLENVGRFISNVIDKPFRRVIIIFGASSLIIVFCDCLAKMFSPGLISIIKTVASGLIVLFLSLAVLYEIFKLVAVIMLLIVSYLDKRIKTNDGLADLKRFLKHRHGPLKNMYRPMVKNHVFEQYRKAWGGSSLLGNDGDSSYYGAARILSTVFLSQLDSGGYGFYYNTHKTLEMIEFMLVVHRSSLKSNIDKISLLVQQWPDLFTRRISWDDYNEKVDSMLSEARKNSSKVEEEDKGIVLDRLESLKHDSDVVNNSPDVARMRGLVDRVHDSSIELAGRVES